MDLADTLAHVLQELAANDRRHSPAVWPAVDAIKARAGWKPWWERPAGGNTPPCASYKLP